MGIGETLKSVPSADRRENYHPGARISPIFKRDTPGFYGPEYTRQDRAQPRELMSLFNTTPSATMIDVMRHADKSNQDEMFTLLENVKSKDQISIDLLEQSDGIINPETGLSYIEGERFHQLWDEIFDEAKDAKSQERQEYVDEQMAHLPQFLSTHYQEVEEALSKANDRLQKLILERKKEIIGTPNPLKDMPRAEVRNITAGGPTTSLPYESAVNNWITYITAGLSGTDTELKVVHDNTVEILKFLKEYRGGTVPNATISAHFERLFESTWLTVEKVRAKRMAFAETLRKTETRSDRPWVYDDGIELVASYHEMAAEVMQLYERLKVPQSPSVEAGQEIRPDDPEDLKRRIINILKAMYDLREDIKRQDDKITQFDTVGYLQARDKGIMLGRMLIDAPPETEIWGYTTKIQRSREADRIIGNQLELLVENPIYQPLLDRINARPTGMLRPVDRRVKAKLEEYLTKVRRYVTTPENLEPIKEPEWTLQDVHHYPELAGERPAVYNDNNFLVIDVYRTDWRNIEAILNDQSPLRFSDGRPPEKYSTARVNKKVIFLNSPISTHLGGYSGLDDKKFKNLLEEFGGGKGAENAVQAAWLGNETDREGKNLQESLNFYPEVSIYNFYTWLNLVRRAKQAPASKGRHTIVYGIAHSVDLTGPAMHLLTNQYKFNEILFSRFMDGSIFSTMEDMPLVYDKNFVLKGGKFRMRNTITNESLNDALKISEAKAEMTGLLGL